MVKKWMKETNNAKDKTVLFTSWKLNTLEIS